MTVGTCEVSMSRGADSAASKTVSGEHISSSGVNVITKEDHTEVVEGSGGSQVPREQSGRVTGIDVVRVPTDTEHDSHRAAVVEVDQVAADLVHVLPRAGTESVLEDAPVGRVLEPVSWLDEEIRNEGRSGSGHGQ